MDDDPKTTPDASNGVRRLVEQADKMVRSGRLTAEEAARLRAAAGTGETEQVIRSIRARHAGMRLDAAVGAGAMSQAEADGLLERVHGGEHSRRLRSHLAQFGSQVPPANPPAGGADLERSRR